MTPAARRALAVIRECVAADRFSTTVHFLQRLAERGLFWPDVEAVVDDPHDVRSKAIDDYGRPKWAIGGKTATGGAIDIICAIDTDETGTEFITLYWHD